MSATVQAEPAMAVQRAGLLGWGTVRAGLGVSFFGTLLGILCPIVLFIVLWTMQGQQDPTAKGQHGPTILQLVALGTFLIGWIGGGMLFITGICMGAAAPAGSGTRGWSFAACFLGPLSVIMLVLLALLLGHHMIRFSVEGARAAIEEYQALNPEAPKPPLPSMPEPIFGANETKGIILGFESVCLLTLLCHLLALRGVASAFHRGSLSVAVVCFMLSSIVWVAGLNVIGLREEELSTRTLEMLGMLILAGLAVLQLWYLVLAGLVRRAIGEGLLQG